MNILGVDPGLSTCGVALLIVDAERSERSRVASVQAHPVDLLAAIRGTLAGWSEVGEIVGQARARSAILALEHVGVYGVGSAPNRGQVVSVARDLMDTCVLIGRIAERWPGEVDLIRADRAKYELTGRRQGVGDPEVRRACIDAFGGDRRAIGGTKCPRCKGKGWRGRGRPTCDECGGSGWEVEPGPLKGVAGHGWDALAVAIVRARRAGHDFQPPPDLPGE